MRIGKSALYIAGSALLFLTQGLGMNLASANLAQVQGSLSATSVEAAWLAAAYMAPNVSLSAALVKIRAQYGLRRFAEIGIVGFVIASLITSSSRPFIRQVVVRFIKSLRRADVELGSFSIC